MSGSSTIRGSPLPYEEEPYPGDKVNPVDVCSASAGSALLSIHDTVDRVNLYRNISIFPRGNLRLRDPSASSHKRTSSSSSFVESTRGVKRSCRKPYNNLEDAVDIYRDHQIAKQEREDGHSQCPFSRCSTDFTRIKDRDRVHQANASF